jgi:Fe2+ or Zn2+ uptake regulation protein
VSDRRPSFADHEARIRGEVLDYLRQHPHAMDSLEGIATWWLPRHEVRVGVELVARALEQLEDEGLLERVGDAERPLFRLRPSRVQAAGDDVFDGRS